MCFISASIDLGQIVSSSQRIVSFMLRSCRSSGRWISENTVLPALTGLTRAMAFLSPSRTPFHSASGLSFQVLCSELDLFQQHRMASGRRNLNGLCNPSFLRAELERESFCLKKPIQCGVVWCGVVWCGVVWCGVVCCGAVVGVV